MPMQLERTLKSSIALSFACKQTEAMAGAGKVGKRPVAPGGCLTLFVGEPGYDKLPKTVAAGDFLTGRDVQQCSTVERRGRRDNTCGRGGLQ